MLTNAMPARRDTRSRSDFIQFSGCWVRKSIRQCPLKEPKTNTANISRKATSSLRSTAEDGIEARYGGFSSAYSPWILSVQDVCALCVHVADWESGKAERIVVDEDGARDEGVVHPPKVPRNPSY